MKAETKKLFVRTAFPYAWVLLMIVISIIQLVTGKVTIELLILQSTFLVAYFLSRITIVLEDIRDKLK